MDAGRRVLSTVVLELWRCESVCAHCPWPLVCEEVILVGENKAKVCGEGSKLRDSLITPLLFYSKSQICSDKQENEHMAWHHITSSSKEKGGRRGTGKARGPVEYRQQQAEGWDDDCRIMVWPRMPESQSQGWPRRHRQNCQEELLGKLFKTHQGLSEAQVPLCFTPIHFSSWGMQTSCIAQVHLTIENLKVLP
jgi:hypothetical protein